MTDPRQISSPAASLPQVASAAVVGAGTMGLGIAMASARGGVPTFLVDTSEDRLTQSKAEATAFFDRSLAKGKLTPEARDAAVTNIRTTTRLDDLAGTDLVIEAIFEDMEAKAALIGELDRVCGPETILASNTSPLSITRIGAHSTRPKGWSACISTCPPS